MESGSACNRRLTTRAGAVEYRMLKLRLAVILCAIVGLPALVSGSTLVGLVQNIDAEGVVTGWAYDKSDPKQNVEIHFYVGPLTTPVGQTIADNSHPVPGSGLHWFWFKLPEQLRPAHGDNPLYAYAVSTRDPADYVQLYRAGSTTPYIYGDLSKAGNPKSD